jgi:hypothetical protein
MKVKFGIRRPSLRKRIAARTSWKRAVRHSLGVKAPRGWGWVTNPRRAAYNRLYRRTTAGCFSLLVLALVLAGLVGLPRL